MNSLIRLAALPALALCLAASSCAPPPRTLTILTDPPGAEIHFQGKKLGTAPLSLDLARIFRPPLKAGEACEKSFTREGLVLSRQGGGGGATLIFILKDHPTAYQLSSAHAPAHAEAFGLRTDASRPDEITVLLNAGSTSSWEPPPQPAGK